MQIEVPAYHGLEPRLALSYSSLGGNGHVGVGWRLEGFDYIESPSKQSYNNYTLRGERLSQCTATSLSPACMSARAAFGSASSYFAPQQDSFVRVQKDDATGSWRVTAKDGVVSTYGGDPAHRFSLNGTTFRWLLSTVVDRHGNTVTYSWDCDPQGAAVTEDCYPQLVSYNGIQATLYWEPRRDTILFATSRVAGGDVPNSSTYLGKTTKRLRSIAVRVDDFGQQKLLRSYQLTYRDSETWNAEGPLSASARSLLGTVEIFGTDALISPTDGSLLNRSQASVLPVRTYKYLGMSRPSLSSQSGSGPGGSYCGGGELHPTNNIPLLAGDFDGNGCADLIDRDNTSGQPGYPKIHLSDCAGGFRLMQTPITLGQWEKNAARWRLGDYNGDGKTDIAVLRSRGGNQPIWIHLSNGANAQGVFQGFTTISTGSTIQHFVLAITSPAPAPAIAEEASLYKVQAADYNGDGLTDFSIIRACDGAIPPICTETKPIQICLTQGSGVSLSWNCVSGPNHTVDSNPDVAKFAYTVHRIKVGDFDGDGRADLARIEGNETTAATAVGMSIFYSRLEGNGSAANPKFETFSNTGPKLAYKSVNYGYLSPSFPEPNVKDDRRVRTGDFNGDGITDIALVNGNLNTLGTMTVHLSKGAGGLFAAPINGPQVHLASTQWMTFQPSWIPIGDFNGDGRTDIGYNTASAPLSIQLSLGYSTTALGFGYSINGPSTYYMDCGQPADFDGDGRDDIASYPGNSVSIFLSTGEPADLLQSAENGMGGRLSVQYTPSSRWSNQGAFPTRQTVSSVTSEDGRGQSARTAFRYSGGKVDRVHRRPLGFSSVVAELPATPDDGSLPPFERSTFLQDFRSPNGLLQSLERFAGDPANGGRLRARLVNEYLVGGPTTTPCAAEEPYATLQTGEWEIEFDGSGTLCDTEWASSSLCARGRRSYTKHQYDMADGSRCASNGEPYWSQGVGNIVRDTLYGDFDRQDDSEQTVHYEFPLSPNYESYVVGLPVSLRIRQSVSGFGPLVEQENYFYDNAPVGDGSPSSTQAIPKGDRTAVARWLNRPTSRYVVSRSEYDPTNGTLVASVDERNNRTEFTYDGTYHRFLTNIKNARLQNVVLDAYSMPCGKPGRVFDFNGNYSAFTYDAFCRTARIDPVGGGYEIHRFSYNATTPDAQYERVEKTGADGSPFWEEIYSDGLGRKWKTKSRGPSIGQELLTVTNYNARGSVVSRTAPYYAADGPAAVTTTFHYDVMGRPISSELPDGSTTSVVYEVRNGLQVVTVADETNRRTRETFDGFGLKIKHEDLNVPGEWATVNYVNGFAETQVVDSGGNVVRIDHDSLGRDYQLTHPDRGIWNFEYTDDGLLYQVLDNRLPRALTEYTYDELGRRIQKVTYKGTLSQETVNWGYDQPRGPYSNVGHITSMVDAFGEESYDYDAAGNLVRKVRNIGSTSYTFQYGWDLTKRLLWKSFPDGDSYGTASNPIRYDGAGRVRSIPWIVDSIDYSANGIITKALLSNGTATDRGLDPTKRWVNTVYTDNRNSQTCTSTTLRRNTCLDDWCGGQTVCGPGTFTCCEAAPFEMIQQLGYTRDASGRVLAVTSPFVNEGWAYLYDGRGQLVSATSSSSASLNQTATIDLKGNIDYLSTIGTYQYGAPSSLGGFLPHAASQAGVSSFHYERNGSMDVRAGGTINYNGENLASRIDTAQYSYDGNGRRIKKVAGGSTTLYIDDDYEVSGSVVSKYIRAGTELIAKRSGGATYWLHSDAQGSLQVITDAYAQVLWRQAYSAWGEKLPNSSPLPESRGFKGERHDTESGLIYLGARYYDPKIGRFLAADPLVQTDNSIGLNAYAFGSNDPVNRRDPDGKDDLFDSEFFSLDGYPIVPCPDCGIVVFGERTTRADLWSARFRSLPEDRHRRYLPVETLTVAQPAVEDLFEYIPDALESSLEAGAERFVRERNGVRGVSRQVSRSLMRNASSAGARSTEGLLRFGAGAVRFGAAGVQLVLIKLEYDETGDTYKALYDLQVMAASEAGSKLGALVGGALTVETGPGMAGGIIGGSIVGGFAGEHLFRLLVPYGSVAPVFHHDTFAPDKTLVRRP